MGIENPVIEFSGYRKADPERRLLSTEKIRKRTDWKPVVSLNQGLDQCVAEISSRRKEKYCESSYYNSGRNIQPF